MGCTYPATVARAGSDHAPRLVLRVCSCASQLAGSPSAVLTGPRFARNCATCASNSRSGTLTKSRRIVKPPLWQFGTREAIPASRPNRPLGSSNRHLGCPSGELGCPRRPLGSPNRCLGYPSGEWGHPHRGRGDGLVVPTAPLLTSPVHGGGTPSPRAGRAGVGAFKAHGLTIPEKCAIIGIAVRWRGRVAKTQLKEEE